MGALFDALQEVQRRKDDDHWQPTGDDIKRVAEGITEQLGALDPKAVEAALAGMGWVMAMMQTNGLDMEEFFVACEWLTEVTMRNVSKIEGSFTPEQGVQAGVGAGFPTGLWVGLLIRGGK